MRWQALHEHHHDMQHMHMREWFAEDPERCTRFSLQQAGLSLNYSRNRVTAQTMSLLCALAEDAKLANQIEALFSGKPINNTENRPALHTALRDLSHTAIFCDGENIAQQISEMREKMVHLTHAITHLPMQHIVNIGIGGSHLGPLMTTMALSRFAQRPLQFHFISTVDLAQLEEVWEKINPEKTLFIVSSKSYTTLETSLNTNTILKRMQTLFPEKNKEMILKHHFIAITANRAAAKQQGIPDTNILPLWKWVGGRYSVWSAIGLPLMLMLGEAQFNTFLQGAYEMDQHFRSAPFAKNMPVILAMLSIWYTHFFNAAAEAIIPYSHKLRYFIPYVQQAIMESNGKRVNKAGELLPYHTSPVIFGLEGCDGQHTYHQLLHQGTHFIPADFILLGKSDYAMQDENCEHHLTLLASALSQAEALMRGKTENVAPYQVIPGNKPSNLIILDELNPKNLGALMALYEHKIFVQGVIWGINSFDQWGVELGKQLLPEILQQLQAQSS